MENLEEKTAQEVFDAAVKVYSDKHNHAYSSFCDPSELPDFIERLRSELGIEPPKAEFVTNEIRKDIEKELRDVLLENQKVSLR